MVTVPASAAALGAGDAGPPDVAEVEAGVDAGELVAPLLEQALKATTATTASAAIRLVMGFITYLLPPESDASGGVVWFWTDPSVLTGSLSVPSVNAAFATC